MTCSDQSFDCISSSAPYEPDPRFEETPLFPAVRNNALREIERLIKDERLDVNAVDSCGRNALQAAFQRKSLTPKACKTLIKMDTNIEHKDVFGNTLLAAVVHYYKKGHYFEKRKEFKIFCHLIEAGADLNEDFEDTLSPSCTREKILAHPEMANFVQKTNTKIANVVLKAMGNEAPEVARLICEMSGNPPPATWQRR